MTATTTATPVITKITDAPLFPTTLTFTTTPAIDWTSGTTWTLFESAKIYLTG